MRASRDGHTIVVDGRTRIEAKAIVIATGSRASCPEPRSRSSAIA